MIFIDTQKNMLTELRMHLKRIQSMFLSVAFSFLLVGCGSMVVVKMEKTFPPPSYDTTRYSPTKSNGKETITKGTEKEVNAEGFVIEETQALGAPAKSVTKGGLKVTVAHVPFDYLEKQHGIRYAYSHPFGNKGKNYYYIGPIPDPMYATNFKVDDAGWYQSVELVPYYYLVEDLYRNDKHEEQAQKVEDDFLNGKMNFPRIDNSEQATNAYLQRGIGQPHSVEYKTGTYVFYIKIENKSAEKIELYPAEHSVLIDSKGNQVQALEKSVVAASYLELWNESYENYYGKTNYEMMQPMLGIVFKKKIKSKKFSIFWFKSSIPEEAGLKVGDVLLNVNGAKINSEDEAKLKRTIRSALRNRKVGDYVEVEVQRNQSVEKIRTKLVSLKNSQPNRPPKPVYGGSIFPGVEKEGFLTFQYERSHEVRDNDFFRLVLPLVGVEFDAANKPIRSIELDFGFSREKKR